MDAVLFDMDGVLADSHDVWFYVMNDVAETLGFPAITPEQMEAAFGQGLAEDERVFYPGTSMEALTRHYEEAFPRHIVHMRANPEAKEVLESLRARGTKVGVVTNTPQGLAEAILSVLELLPLIDVTAGLRPGIREKPAPDLVLDVLARLSVDAGNALMLGDSIYDGQAAEAAGVPFRLYQLKAGTSLRTFLSDVP
ncbi:MAG: HAD family hydrolase [Planctomycetota bacterium]|nr:HAD family hydrolase [Planctomycetota bacterium]